MNMSRPSAFRTYCVGVVTAAMLLQPLAGYAVPITTSYLNETPLQGLNPVKPNIMLTLDDSGSMAAENLPDFTTFVAVGISHCRTGTPQLQCGGWDAAQFTRLVPPQPARGPGSIPELAITVFDPPVRSSNY